jgi:hypothetical protein
VVQFERGKLTTFPGSYFPPTIKNGLASITHAENALALLPQHSEQKLVGVRGYD